MNKNLSILILLLFSYKSFAITGTEIIKKVFAKKKAQSSYTKANLLSCTYKDVDGKKKCISKPRKKSTEGVSLNKNGEGTTLMVILSPSNEKGMTFLQKSYEDVKKDTEQSMYLPALKKIKRIVSESGAGPKTGTLFGSEFSYEDMEKNRIEDGVYKLLKEEKLRKNKCFVVETLPTEQRKLKTSYKKVISWIDKKDFVVRKVEMYDRNDDLVKTLSLKKYKEFNGVSIPRLMVMTNHKKKRMSMIRNSDYNVNIEVNEKIFTERSLKDSAFRNKLLDKVKK